MYPLTMDHTFLDIGYTYIPSIYPSVCIMVGWLDGLAPQPMRVYAPNRTEQTVVVHIIETIGYWFKPWYMHLF